MYGVTWSNWPKSTMRWLQAHALTKPALGTRSAARPAAAAAAKSAQPESTGDEAADEMTQEQIAAEQRAALANMPTFGGGLSSETVQQNPVSTSGSGQQDTLEGHVPRSSFPFGMPAVSVAAGLNASAPEAGPAPSAWPSLIRTHPPSADASGPVSQQASPASIFGRLTTGGASASGPAVSQQVLASPLHCRLLLCTAPRTPCLLCQPCALRDAIIAKN